MFEIAISEAEFSAADVSGVEIGAWSQHSAALQNALAQRGVVCLHLARALEDEELQSLVRLFGPIKDPVGRTKDGGEFRYSEPRQVIDSGFVMTDEVREKLGDLNFGGLDDDRPGLFETFHCDDTYTERPAQATVLHARALPPSGGGPTCFIDMRAAYTLLDTATKERLRDLRVVYAYNNKDAFPPRRAARGPGEALVDVTHPLVRTHPVTDSPALFIDLDRACHLDGLPIAEGRALLQELQDHAEKNALAWEHHWADHDVLVWDNASVQHKAAGNFKLGEPRRFWRYMVEGDQPR
jgi:alpha-ketoglutarate-dependent taurine dioxygenase